MADMEDLYEYLPFAGRPTPLGMTPFPVEDSGMVSDYTVKKGTSVR